MSVRFRFYYNCMRILCVPILFLVGFITPVLSSNNLPSGYTELEYIETTGVQYINTNMTFFDSLNYKIDLDVSFNEWYDYQGIFTSTDHSTQFESWIYGTGKANFRVGGTVAKGSVVLDTNTKYNFKYSNTGSSNNVLNITHDGTVVETLTSVSSSTTSGYYLVLFVSGGYAQSKAKWYRVSIEKNGVLTRNFIPAKRNSDSTIGMYDTVNNTFYTNSGTGTFTAGPEVNVEIKIATTSYVESAFADSVSELNTTMGTIKNVVDNTIIQADRIGKLHTGKQNRPDDSSDSEKCPAGRDCLLITEADGTLHWYPICGADGSVEPLFVISIFLSQLTSAGDSRYYHGNTTTYNELGGTGSAYTSQPSTDSIVRQLNETEWAILWTDYGVVYGTSVCSSDGKFSTTSVTTRSEQTETKGKYCWCKMTGVGDTEGNVFDIDGTLWVGYGGWDKQVCAKYCPNYCTLEMQNKSAFRSAVLSVDN